MCAERTGPADGRSCSSTNHGRSSQADDATGRGSNRATSTKANHRPGTSRRADRAASGRRADAYRHAHDRPGCGCRKPRSKALDDSTWELKLRPGISFHNGEPFDANAVKFSFARYVDPSIKNGYATLLKPVTEVQVIDPMTVHVKTSEPFAELIETLSAYVEMLPPKAAADPNAVASKPIGTGPYKFVSWTPNDRFVVQAAGAHWNASPRMQQVVFRPIPDSTARINELKSGGVDIITNVPPLEISTLQGAAGISLARATNAGSIILIPSFMNTDVFKKKEVRQALQYAIDKDQLIKVVLRGEAVPMSSPFPKGVAGGYVDGLPQYAYDPEKAKALLAQAGYPDGFSFNFKAPDGRYLQDKAVAEAITGQLAKVGIKAELETVEWSTYVQGIVGRKYELFLLSQGGLQVGPTTPKSLAELCGDC